MWLEPSFFVRWVACALLLAGLTAPATAAKVYRCGNVFQDRPCESDKEADTRKDTASRDAKTPATAKTAGPIAAASTANRLNLEVPRSVAIEPRR